MSGIELKITTPIKKSLIVAATIMVKAVTPKFECAA
jgi:hypothetical protein